MLNNLALMSLWLKGISGISGSWVSFVAGDGPVYNVELHLLMWKRLIRGSCKSAMIGGQMP